MFDPDQYELIDFGRGIKVERFGNRVIARQSPSVDRFEPRRPTHGYKVDSRYEGRGGGKACWAGSIDNPWDVSYGEVRFSLRQTPTGQIGLFPEQCHNWNWISEHSDVVNGKRAINLFAYTGGSTLALAAAGAKVTHVDSASSVVSWARANAASSNLDDCPVRWIVEDAMKFVRREIKRGNTYDIFVADPPSFGRGPKNETWKIERDLAELFHSAAALCPDPKMVIISYHTPELRRSKVAEMVSEQFGVKGGFRSLELTLATSDGRILPSGECVRFFAGG